MSFWVFFFHWLEGEKKQPVKRAKFHSFSVEILYSATKIPAREAQTFTSLAAIKTHTHTRTLWAPSWLPKVAWHINKDMGEKEAEYSRFCMSGG